MGDGGVPHNVAYHILQSYTKAWPVLDSDQIISLSYPSCLCILALYILIPWGCNVTKMMALLSIAVCEFKAELLTVNVIEAELAGGLLTLHALKTIAETICPPKMDLEYNIYDSGKRGKIRSSCEIEIQVLVFHAQTVGVR